jgi:hypothetical protein
VERDACLPVILTRWADVLRDRGLGDLAGLFVQMLQVWGFVGGQILWMLVPFVGETTLAPLARTLEDPDALEALRGYLVDGTPVIGLVKGE